MMQAAVQKSQGLERWQSELQNLQATLEVSPLSSPRQVFFVVGTAFDHYLLPVSVFFCFSGFSVVWDLGWEPFIGCLHSVFVQITFSLFLPDLSTAEIQ